MEITLDRLIISISNKHDYKTENQQLLMNLTFLSFFKLSNLIGVMIICSKFDCSKNLLDTVRAIIFFLVNCSKIKNHEKSSAVCVFRAVSLLDKKILTARIAIGQQRFWKMSTARRNL